MRWTDAIPNSARFTPNLPLHLDGEINFLLSEDEEFVLQAQQSYGYKGAKDAEELVADVSALFAGGELSENDKDAIMRALQDAYWMAKERNKEKYTPKKYRNPIEVEE